MRKQRTRFFSLISFLLGKTIQPKVSFMVKKNADKHKAQKMKRIGNQRSNQEIDFFIENEVRIDFVFFTEF